MYLPHAQQYEEYRGQGGQGYGQSNPYGGPSPYGQAGNPYEEDTSYGGGGNPYSQGQYDRQGYGQFVKP